MMMKLQQMELFRRLVITGLFKYVMGCKLAFLVLKINSCVGMIKLMMIKLQQTELFRKLEMSKDLLQVYET